MGRKIPRPVYRPKPYADFHLKSRYSTERNSSQSNYSRNESSSSSARSSELSKQPDWIEKSEKTHPVESNQYDWEKILDNIESEDLNEHANDIAEIKSNLKEQRIEADTQEKTDRSWNLESSDIASFEPDRASLEKFFKEVDGYLIEVSNAIKNDKTEAREEKTEKFVY